MSGRQPSRGGETLRGIVRSIDERALTLSLYNVNAARDVLQDVQSYFAVQSVHLQRAHTDDGLPTNFAVLHDDEEFHEAAALRDIYRVVRPDSALLDLDDPDDIDYPDLLREIDQSLFSGYDRTRMILASRDVEEYAYRNGGTVHAGFQHLSNLSPQADLYQQLADAGVDTHLYGAPDAEVADAHTVHASTDRDVTDTWFVVRDGDDGRKRALLAEERADDEFFGFWTFDDDIVDRILGRLTDFPPTA